MKTKAHIVSTRSLTLDQIHQLELTGLSVTHTDLIQQSLSIPENINLDHVHETIVLTSKIAIRAWFEIAEKNRINLQDHPVYCLALATQYEAKKNNMPVVGVAFDATALAEVILNQNKIQAVTFVCSNRRRDELPDKLRNQNIKVDEIHAYQTTLVPTKIERPFHAVIFFSPSGIDSFLELNQAGSAIAFCIGETTETHALKSGFKKTILSPSPSIEELLKTVNDYYFKYEVHA